MKKILITLGLAAGLTAFGQPGGGNPPNAAQMIQRRVDRLATILTLTEAQKSSAIALFTAAENAAAPLRTALRTNMTPLQAAVKSNDTAAIDRLTAANGTAQGQLMAVQLKADAGFYALLSAEQKAKFDTLRGGMGGGRGGPGMGPRGMGGLPPAVPDQL